jgi:hypothetical protein
MYISFKSLRLTIAVNILVHRWWVSKGLRLLIQPTLKFHKQHYSFTVGSRHPSYGSQLASLLYSGKPTPQLWLPVRITLRRILLVLWFSMKRWKILKKLKHLKHNVQSCRITILLFLFCFVEFGVITSQQVITNVWWKIGWYYILFFIAYLFSASRPIMYFQPQNPNWIFV